MSRSLIIGIVVTFLLIGGLATFFYINYIKVKHVPAVNAVPDDAALILEVKNIQAGWAAFSASDMWADLKKNDAIGQLNARIVFMDSLISANTTLKEILEENKAVISMHVQGGQQASLLFVAEAGTRLNAQQLTEWIAQTGRFTTRKRSFEKEAVYDLLNADRMPVLSIAFRDQLLICSPEGTLVEEALRKLKYKIPNATKGFEQVAAMAEVSSDASVYVNYQHLNAFMGIFAKSEYAALFDCFGKFANWSMFDVKIAKDMFTVSGVSYTDDSVFQYLDLFKTQTPLNMRLHTFMPKHTAMMLQTSYSDYTKFGADLNEYLQVHGKLDGYIRFSDSLENRYGIDLGSPFISLIGSEAMLGMLEPLGSDYQKELFAVVKFADKAQAETLLKSYALAIRKRGETDSITVPAHNGFAIERLHLGNFLKLYYGELFEQIHSPFYTVVNDAFVFANDPGVLQTIIDNYLSGNTFEKDEQFVKYTEHSASTANINFFFSPNRSFMLPAAFVTDEFLSVLNRYQYDFRKFEYLSVQFANSNNKAFFTNLNFKFNPSFKEETRTLWSVKLDTTFDMAPAIVYNSTTRQNCILAQDVNNTLYYISNTGTILWRSKLSGKIISTVQQVDAQKNGHTSYLFNTEKQTCLVDENGNNLPGFPVRFPGKATAALSLFDFYGDSAYRFFVPLENNRVMGYDLHGKPLQGWNPKTTEEKISVSLASVKIGQAPYLLAGGSKGGLLMYTVKGEKVKLESPVYLQAALPVLTSSSDTLHAYLTLTDTNGVMAVFSIDSTFMLKAGNSYKLGLKPTYLHARSGSSGAWIVLAGNETSFSVYDKPGHQSVTQKMADSPYVQPFIHSTATGEVMIGYADQHAQQLHWINTSGTAHPSFPMKGYGAFTVGNMMLDGSNYLVAGDQLNNLVLVRLK